MPANSELDIENYLNKVITYELDSPFASWMNNNLVVAQHFIDTTVISEFEQFANSLIIEYPNYFNNYFFTEDESSPNFGNRDSIVNFLNSKGATSLWLIGHTFNTQFGYNNILDTGDVTLFNNNPMNFITFFSLRQFFASDTSVQGFADKLLLDGDGTIAIIGPVGSVFSGINHQFLRTLMHEFFGLERKGIGEAIISVRNLFPYSYTVRMYNQWGDPSLVPKYDITVDVDDPQTDLPTKFKLEQNYPNPFNPLTKINYQIPEFSFVTIKVCDVLGSEVATLVNEVKSVGSYEVEFDGTGLPSGIYFYRLQAGSFVVTKKMVLMK